VRTGDGGEELFVVNKLDQVLDSLAEAGLAREPESGPARPGPLGPPPGT
jgi:hypothetical protein